MYISAREHPSILILKKANTHSVTVLLVTLICSIETMRLLLRSREKTVL